MTVVRSPRQASFRHAVWPWRSRRRPGVAIDMGSARTRAWVPGRGIILDVRTVTFGGTGISYPVQRGTIVNAVDASRMLERVLGHRVRHVRHTVIAVTTPVLDGIAYREAARTALEALGPSEVVTIPTAKAIAMGSGADTSRPLLIVDIGAQLTEVFLLTDGEVTDAHRALLGTDDIGQGSCSELVGSVAATMTGMLRRDRSPQTFDALRRGVLLAGGGALRPEIAHSLSTRLRVPVRPAPAPHTVAVRGAARHLQAVRGHPLYAELTGGVRQML